MGSNVSCVEHPKKLKDPLTCKVPKVNQITGASSHRFIRKVINTKTKQLHIEFNNISTDCKEVVFVGDDAYLLLEDNTIVFCKHNRKELRKKTIYQFSENVLEFSLSQNKSLILRGKASTVILGLDGVLLHTITYCVKKAQVSEDGTVIYLVNGKLTFGAYYVQGVNKFSVIDSLLLCQADNFTTVININTGETLKSHKGLWSWLRASDGSPYMYRFGKIPRIIKNDNTSVIVTHNPFEVIVGDKILTYTGKNAICGRMNNHILYTVNYHGGKQTIEVYDIVEGKIVIKYITLKEYANNIRMFERFVIYGNKIWKLCTPVTTLKVCKNVDKCEEPSAPIECADGTLREKPSAPEIEGYEPGEQLPDLAIDFPDIPEGPPGGLAIDFPDVPEGFPMKPPGGLIIL